MGSTPKKKAPIRALLFTIRRSLILDFFPARAQVIPAEEVAPQLAAQPVLLCRYLDRLFALGLLPRRLADRLVDLLADHAPERLDDVLARCTSYTLTKSGSGPLPSPPPSDFRHLAVPARFACAHTCRRVVI